MRIHGWCTECRKIKRVTVTSAAMASLARGGVAQGVCADCEDKRRAGRGR
jgi:hypothetical protein